MNYLILIFIITYLFNVLCGRCLAHIEHGRLPDSPIKHHLYYSQNIAVNGAVISFSYNPASQNSPDKWYKTYSACGGKVQSPIDIDTAKVIHDDSLSHIITGTKWTEMPATITVSNEGYNIQVKFVYADAGRPRILLNGNTYEFAQLHFHFGLENELGSEHRINNQAFSLEGHAVFFNQKYKSVANATNYSDGLAVVARLYDEDGRYEKIHPKFSFARHVRSPNDTYTLSDKFDLFSLEEVLGPLNMPYYSYQGSLTTPGCFEVVTWCVGAQPLRISDLVLIRLRKVNGLAGQLAPNFRPLQNRNGRNVFYYK